MKGTAKRTIGAVVLIIGLVLLGWHLGRRVATRVSFAKAGAPTTATVELHAPAARNIPIKSGSADLLHADLYAELVRDINAGNADAAYRLAQGKQACMELQGKQFFYRSQVENVRSMDTSSDEYSASAKELADTKSAMDKMRDACIGEVNIGFSELSDAWALAARMGSRDAQYEYAKYPGLNSLAIGIDIERWRQWRDSAPGYMEGLLDEGDARAALIMAAASDQDDCDALDGTSQDANFCTNGSFLAEILPHDLASAYMYYVLDQLLGDTANAAWVASELSLLERSMTPEEITSAKAQAQRRFLRVRSGP